VPFEVPRGYFSSMRAERIVARGFRNLADLDLALPPGGAVFLGPNGHGKTNLLEALYYPVLFRSLRGARDIDVTRHGEAGFEVALTLEATRRPREISAGFRIVGKRKRLALDGVAPERLSAAIGHWLAVAFLPTDLGLVQGAAAERRRYLDRVLSLSDRSYLRTLSRYRAALAQRNAALRQRRPELARPFDATLAAAGASLVRSRLEWTAAHAEPFSTTCRALGEIAEVTMRYRGDEGLADPANWPKALAGSAGRDEALGATTVGPHRHDLDLRLGSRPLRAFGSTGQHRTAAVALKLCERQTLAATSGSEPALLLDDVFAELDQGRQERLAALLLAGGARQTFITAPREDELPDAFHLDTLAVQAGRVSAMVEKVTA
jgi:DNA replication and repair protein RecF